jgi:hypothetical protein
MSDAIKISQKEFANTLRIVLQADMPINVLVQGSPGIGKTQIIKEVAADCGYDVEFIHGVTCDPTDTKGLPCKITDPDTMEERAVFLPYDSLERIINAKKPLLVFFDDLGQAPQMVQASSMQMVDERRINQFRIPDTVRFVAATNRRKDRAGATGIISALINRFRINVELNPDVNDWVLHSLKDETIDPLIVSFVRFVHAEGDPVFKFDPSKELENSPTPRAVTGLGQLSRVFGDQLTLAHAAGCVGDDLATKFMAFKRTYSQMPDPDQVLANPDKAVVPDRPDILYALTGALAARANKKTIESLVKYSKRMGDAGKREFGVLMMKDVHLRDKAKGSKEGLCSTPAMSQWLAENKDLLI